ncbi:MAG: isocitrate/isopropylmalate dehydrogenase family protein [Anaerolineales bacterium]|nr:isocitrate/isopropylmalate dehydrogenase family protein [Anaerolineales bacterium]
MTHRVVVIEGDGIGPEVVAATKRVIDATGVRIDWIPAYAGSDIVEEYGTPLPDETIALIREVGVALKGPTATPIGKGFRSVNVAIRKALNLFANYRPARTVKGVPSRYDDVDLIVIRENTEGLYSGLEHEVVPGVVESLRVVTREGSERIVRFAFETAQRYHRQTVTVVHKANILKLSDGLFLDVARKVAADYPQINYNESIVDATAMKLVIDPHQFDVLVMENLFGDIVSDLTSGLVGGLGMAPSANIGKDCAVFEAVHGSAPDIAGQGKANPSAVLLSGALMLNHIGEEAAAEQVKRAVERVVGAGDVLTGDLGGRASTEEYTDAVIAAL